MKARNLWLIIPWALFVAAALAWIFYWNYLAGEAERRVHAWQFEQNASGATVEIGQVVRHGFPVFLRLELRDVRYAASRGGWRIAWQAVSLLEGETRDAPDGVEQDGRSQRARRLAPAIRTGAAHRLR